MAALDKDEILTQIEAGARTFVSGLDVFGELESTNSFLLAQPIENGRARVCVTEAQSKGRGRHGNEWVSTPHKNIMMSLSWGFSEWPDTVTGLGLAVSLMVAERLNLNFGTSVEIKWPNDLMVDDAKLAGVLIDVSGHAGSACNVVVGLGLNVFQPDWSKTDAPYAWQDLSSLGVNVNRNELIAQISGDLIYMLRRFADEGFSPFVEAWNELSCHTNRDVIVMGDDISVSGKMLGVDKQGGLLVQSTDGEVHVFSNNNVSVRLR